MDLTQTWIGLGVAAAVFALAWVMHRRPYVPGRIWRVPWVGVMWLALLAVILMIAHLVTLISGQPLKSRFMPF
ncbi:MAG: hypothetical protein KDE22_10605 [Rhodobacterales bacterium]|nr:hypothetical protein [Rhodobacterales bacterium]